MAENIESFGNRAASAAETGADKARSAAEGVAENVKDTASRVASTAQDTAGKLRSNVSEFGGQVYDQGLRATQTMSRTVEERPYMAAAVAGLFGLLIGILVTRRD